MLSMEASSRIASSFLAHYYNEFTMPNSMASMIDMYDDQSYVVTVDLGQEAPTVAHGRREVAVHLARLDHSLGLRKVEVITADQIPLMDGAIQVICQGIMYLRQSRRVFLHAFVLAPTLHRTSTFHIASDYLRFVNAEEEIVPEGAILLTPDQVASFLAEEARRVEEQRQRQQLLEFQQRLRAQNTVKAPQPDPHTHAHVHQEEQRIAIPTPASKQRLQQNGQNQNGQHQNGKPAAPPAAAASGAPADTRGRSGQDGESHGRAGEGRGHGGEGRGRGESRGRGGEGRGRGGYDGEGRGRGGEGRGRGGEARGRGYGGEGRGRGGHEGEGRGRGGAEGRGRGRGGDAGPRSYGPAVGAAAQGGRGRGGRGERPPAAQAGGSQKPDATPAAAQAAANTDAKGEGKKEERKRRADSGPTEFIRLIRVPRAIKLSEIKEELTKANKEPKDAYWFGADSAHAVVKLASAELVAATAKSGKVKILNHEVNVAAFYP